MDGREDDQKDDILPERAEAPTSVPAELELSPFEQGAEKAAGKLGGRIGHCGRSAFHHLRRAWRLLGVDDEMAAFRAITAEEEAATAVILALKQRQYPGANHLNQRNHAHKAALVPFTAAVQNVLAISKWRGDLVLSPESDPPRVNFRIDARCMGVEGDEPLFVEPDEPLNMVVRSVGEDGVLEVHDFEAQLREVARGSDLTAIRRFVEDEANFRNRLLYASDDGVPKVTLEAAFLRERLRRVVQLLLVAVAVLQTPRVQPFAAQCLRALLRVLPRLNAPEPEFDYDTAAPPVLDSGLLVEQDGDGRPRAMLRRRWSVNIPFGYRLLPVIHLDLNVALSGGR
ncbi:MAG: hypothetical protein K2X11_11940 [Acetobacteraceae bacterium]|nr:hypothetical protein [Acetobacteraceae bacterium]